MFEDFGQIKDELGASFALFSAVIFPIAKLYIASINRRFAELKREIEKVEGDRDRLSKRLFEAFDGIKSEIHALSLKIAQLEVKIDQNGRHHEK